MDLDLSQGGRWPVQVGETLDQQQRIVVEDLLRALLEYEHRGQAAGDAMLGALAQMPHEQALPGLVLAESCGFASFAAGVWTLTAEGRSLAVLVMRAHRLMETKLARETGVPAAEWHGIAHREEHMLGHAEVERLAVELGHPRFDPHGDPIPTKEGVLPAPEGEELLNWPVGRPGMIMHVEDEPEALYRQLVKEGVHAGMRFERLPGDALRCALRIEAREKVLPAELAALLRVGTVPFGEAGVPAEAFRLSDLGAGGSAAVLSLLPGCRGQERSRLLDLGFVPGSTVQFFLKNPLGGSAAYRVRGTLVALRTAQAEQVLMAPLSS